MKQKTEEGNKKSIVMMGGIYYIIKFGNMYLK